MYTLNQEQISSIQGFISKIPDSMAKGHYEKWLSEVIVSGRVTGEQLEKFVSFTNSLPPDLQNYPQSFAHWLKNGVNTEHMEQPPVVETPPVVQAAHMGAEVDQSIANVTAETVESKEENKLAALQADKVEQKKAEPITEKKKATRKPPVKSVQKTKVAAKPKVIAKPKVKIAVKLRKTVTKIVTTKVKKQAKPVIIKKKKAVKKAAPRKKVIPKRKSKW